ncbi:MAG TPA: hypothetical protein VFY06_07635 [Verrucomicrobiae bacterium]|nr:hypothetical protein [Verrucomicrobiae bacterium]
MKRRTSLLFAALLLAVAPSLPAQTDLIARIHFAGGDRIAADPDHVAFTNEFASPEARALESQTLDKLSRLPGEWFKAKLPAGAGDGAAQLRLLMDDLLTAEWTFEMRDAPGSPEYALAIRLNDSRAQLWSKNLTTLLQNWTGIKVTEDTPGTWELKKHDPPNLFQFKRTGDWVVIDCGQNKLSLGDQVLHGTTVSNDWLSVNANWPRLAQLFPGLKVLDLPKFQIQVVGRDKKLHLTGKLTLAQPLPALGNWQMPTGAIHMPLVSLTAARGIGPWLARQTWMQPFKLQPQPDQMFIWAMARVPFQTFAAEPVPDAKAALTQIYQRLSNEPIVQDQFMSPVRLEMTNDEISLHGLPPLITPYIKALHEPTGDFLLGGFFVNPSRTPPPPPELLAPMKQSNLVYYHWEITSERLLELPQFSQLLLVLTRRQQINSQSAAGKWLDHIGPTLGGTVTEVTQTGPNELTFQRTAPGGLTALELIAFTDWLEAPAFPALSLRLPPPRAHPGQRPFNMLSPPAAPAH